MHSEPLDSNIPQVQLLVFFLDEAHEAEEILLFLHEFGLVEARGQVVEVGHRRLRPAAAPCPRVLAVLDEVGEIRVVLLDVGGELVVFVGVDGEEGGHQDEFFHLRVIVPVVEELVEPVAGLLGLSDKEEMVADLLLAGLLDALEGKLGEFLDVGVVNGQVAEVHEEEVDHLAVLQVVPAHLVEGELRLQNVVAEVQDHEALIDHLDKPSLSLHPPAAHVPLSVAVGVDVEDELLEVLAVEADYVLVYELPLKALTPPFPLLPLGEDIVVDLLSNHLHELGVERFLDDGVGEDQPLDPLHIAAGPYLFEEESGQFFAFLVWVLSLGGVRVVVDADIDLVVGIAADIDIDADVILALPRRRQVLRSIVQDLFGDHHVVSLVDLALLEHLLQLAPPEKSPQHPNNIIYQSGSSIKSMHPTHPQRYYTFTKEEGYF